MSHGHLDELREAFSSVSVGQITDDSDLTVLGDISTLAEKFLEYSGLPYEINVILQTLTLLSSRIILNDANDDEMERSLLIESVVGLTMLEGKDLSEAAVSLDELVGRINAYAQEHVPELASAFPSHSKENPEESFSIEMMGISEKDIPESSIDPDQVIITSDEDRVVYEEFTSESFEHMDTIEESILKLEHDPENIEIINRTFRCFHSIKGAAGFLGLCTTNLLCHDLENLLDRARKQTLVIDRITADIILSSCDLLKKLLQNIRDQLKAPDPAAFQPAQAVDIRPAKAAIKKLLTRDPIPQKGVLGDEGPDVTRLGGKLVEAGIISTDVLSRALMEQKRPLGKILVDMGEASPELVEEVSRTLPTQKRQTDSIKVDTKKLDEMLAQVGELVISQAIVSTDPFLQRSGSEGISRNISNLMKITRSLQDMVMGLRMLPLRQTFQRMFRLVRDTASKTGKEVTLTLNGEDTEIDKTLIDEITDPLVHLMRNAVDHGIEMPDERRAKGKPPEGDVRLMAYHHGGNVVIELRDDGAGLSRERILKKAIAIGLASPDREYTDNEVFDFILAPGFSTRDKATDISGRGVGMDVVRRNIEGVGGRLEIRSVEGHGSTFIIRLPITMAIVDGMIIRVGEEKYVIPTLSIEESIQPRQDMFCNVSGKGRVIMLRDEVIKVARLNELLREEKYSRKDTANLILIVSTEDQKLGLIVDEILGQQQVVIKSMGDSLRGLQGVAGGCILGDGRVALILDIASLFERAQEGVAS